MLRHINKNNLIIPKLLVKEIKYNKELCKSFNFSHNRQKYILMDYVCAILKVINSVYYGDNLLKLKVAILVGNHYIVFFCN